MFSLMLAKTITLDNLTELRYPLIAQPKLNGVRVVRYRDALYTRQGLKVENRFLQSRFASLPHGFEGELIAGSTFAETSGMIRSVENVPNKYTLVLFDNLSVEGCYSDRMADVKEYVYSFYDAYNVEYVNSTECFRSSQVSGLYLDVLKQPYPSGEGLILRDPHAFYRPGRSTLQQQALLKMKRSSTGFAEVVGKTPIVRGSKERPELGSMTCMSKEFARPFNIGTGFSHEQRVHLWKHCGIGDRVEFEYFEMSDTGAPLHPRFKFLVNPSTRNTVA